MAGRCVQPELLDSLPVNDPRAQRSRADLRRVNAWMGNPGIVAGALRDVAPGRLTDLGSGDGWFLHKVRSRLGWEGEAVGIDREPAGPGVIKSDVFEWLETNRSEIIIANLFLHHFDGELPALLRLIASRCRVFVACEPRRSWLAQAGVAGLGLIGCNAVTRHDARVSVRAGFAGRELSACWPDPAKWELREGRARLFSHLFVARYR